MTTVRTSAAGLVLVLVGLVLALVGAGPAAADAGPAYPPAADADGVVQAGGAEHGEGPESAEVGEAAEADNPDAPDEPGSGGDDEEATGDAATTEQAAPGGDGRGAGPYLVVLGTAILLGGAVVAVARRL